MQFMKEKNGRDDLFIFTAEMHSDNNCKLTQEKITRHSPGKKMLTCGIGTIPKLYHAIYKLLNIITTEHQVNMRASKDFTMCLPDHHLTQPLTFFQDANKKRSQMMVAKKVLHQPCFANSHSESFIPHPAIILF